MMQEIKFYHNEKGLTLIEVVASIVILTLIITSFTMMFIQSAKTNKTSENIIDSTYYAQVEMENIHAISKEYTFNERENAMAGLSYVTIDSTVFTKNKNDKYFETHLTKESDSLARVLVQVYNNNTQKKLEAQMETLLSWEESAR